MDKEELCRAIARGMEKCPMIKCQLGINIGDGDIETIAKEIMEIGHPKLPKETQIPNSIVRINNKGVK